MGVLDFNTEAGEQMRKVQAVITAAVIPFRENTEAAIVVFALVRCARILLSLYPEKVRLELVSVLCDFLENRDTPPGEAAASPLWMPENRN